MTCETRALTRSSREASIEDRRVAAAKEAIARLMAGARSSTATRTATVWAGGSVVGAVVVGAAAGVVMRSTLRTGRTTGKVQSHDP
ncbi:hypothetical protein GCM10009600_01790 [Oerskovia paurometabola]